MRIKDIYEEDKERRKNVGKKKKESKSESERERERERGNIACRKRVEKKWERKNKSLAKKNEGQNQAQKRW